MPRSTSDETNVSDASHNNQESFFSEVIKFALIALVIVLPIRLFVAQPFIVSGSSMVPTFKNGEYLIVDELTYRFETPDRGDVVIFRFPGDTKKFFIKRIIGLPGETVVITRGDISIINDMYPEGIPLEEGYIEEKSFESGRVELGPDEYFVMGDNRRQSSDSRSWGPLPDDLLIGRALVRLLPITSIDTFPGAYDLP